MPSHGGNIIKGVRVNMLCQGNLMVVMIGKGSTQSRTGAPAGPSAETSPSVTWPTDRVRTGAPAGPSVGTSPSVT